MPINAPWVQGDKHFQRKLAEGHKWATKVEQRLNALGYETQLTPYEWRPVEQRAHFVNEHDLLVKTSVDKWALLECKSRRLAFTDDPGTYPYRTAFVDTVHGWERKEDPVAAVVLVSQFSGGMLVVPASSRPAWRIRKTMDTREGFEDQWYECPKQKLETFGSLCQWLSRFS